MVKGEQVYTPRFCTVVIEDVFATKKSAEDAGYVEPTHYHKNGYGILGKMVGVNLMEFAAYKDEK